MKHMGVVALRPCLPFACHRCGCRPESVSAEHPLGEPELGRKRWFSALQVGMELECVDCLVLAAAEARVAEVGVAEFVWHRGTLGRAPLP